MGSMVCLVPLNANLETYCIVTRAIDLGVQVWYGNALGEMEVVEIELMSGQLILIPITVSGVEYWVTVAHNHVCLL